MFDKSVAQKLSIPMDTPQNSPQPPHCHLWACGEARSESPGLRSHVPAKKCIHLIGKNNA